MESYLTAHISASAIRANIALLRERLSPGTRLCAVVKADCYGHGQEHVVGLLSEEADCLGVATPEEALELRRMGWQRPILMFFSAFAHCDALEALIAADIWLTVVSPAEAAPLAEAGRRVGRRAQVHVKIDSGMGRSGLLPEAAPGLVREIRQEPSLHLVGLYTHFAVAEEADKAYTLRQLQRYLSAVEASGSRNGLLLHAANSAATIDLPQTHLDMVRPGIAIYGYQPSDKMHVRLPLRPALRLTAPLMQVRDLPAGTRCGYGLRYTFTRDSRVGLVPVGYGDGYFRCLSNKALVQVRERMAPIRGTISMDQIIVDLTDVPSATVGDEVEIISPDPAAAHSVESLARLAGTIPYEVTCRLGGRVRRVLVD